jgi:cytochrome c peroxidase
LNQGGEFKEALAGETNPITVDHFAKALGAFERTLATPSHFDSFLKGDIAALSEQEKMGLKTSMETRCIMCHSVLMLGARSIKNPEYLNHTGNTARVNP